MNTYEIPQGTPGVLLIQEPDVDVKTENFAVRKKLCYTEANVRVTPEKLLTHGKFAYEKGSMASRFAEDNYYVFSDAENVDSSYMIAIQANLIRIS